MHDLLCVCKSTVPHLLDHQLQLPYDVLIQESADAMVIDVSAVADHAYQIEAHWGFNPMKTLWVPLALTDPALLNSVLFCSDQFGASTNGQKERPSAIKHLKETIRILNKRLQYPLQEINDSTIAAVSLLALTEVGAPVILFGTH